MPHPLLLEINTRCWLFELSGSEDRVVTLANVPSAVFDDWVQMGLTHVWLMGVWTIGPLSRAQALNSPALRGEFDISLAGWQERDVLGSPYAIAGYDVPEGLGGKAGLVCFRGQLHQCGIKLVLDFVPNHLGLDHPWIREHPERFVQSAQERLFTFQRETQHGQRWIAHGRDPYFPPWTDTAQLDYRLTEVREAVIHELTRIAEYCDGVRCDMAMLLLRNIFETTWKEFPVKSGGVARQAEEFWSTCISHIKSTYPGFLFLAEAYWDCEERLQQLGFDFTYDKQVADALLQHRPQDLIKHLEGPLPLFIGKSVHFLENHDEMRVASVLSLEEHRAAALAVLALPGMRLLHDGQMQGARLRTPVQLGRRAVEPVDADVSAMYDRLLNVLNGAGAGEGEGSLLRPRSAWDGNPTHQNILAIQWTSAPDRLILVVINLADHRSQCRVALQLPAESGRNWHLNDLLGAEHWVRAADELRQPGLFLDVPAHAAQVFECQPVDAG